MGFNSGFKGLKHSNLNMLFQLLKLHNLVASLSYKDIYQYGALIHIIIRTSKQALHQPRTKYASFNE